MYEYTNLFYCCSFVDGIGSDEQCPVVEFSVCVGDKREPRVETLQRDVWDIRLGERWVGVSKLCLSQIFETEFFLFKRILLCALIGIV